MPTFTKPYLLLGDGFKYLFEFLPPFGEDSHFDSYFSNGLKPPTSLSFFMRSCGQFQRSLLPGVSETHLN